MIRFLYKVMAMLFMAGNIPVLLIAQPVASAQNQKATAPVSFDFIENKGQWAAPVHYKMNLPNGVMFVTDKGFVYSYQDVEDVQYLHEGLEGHVKDGKEQRSLHNHSYKVNFVHSNNNIKYHTADKRSYYHNYFIGNDSTKWTGNVGLFGKVVQKDIYKGIDVATYSKNGSLKYDFIVAAGADPEHIVLEYEGVSPQVTKEGHLKIGTTVNEIIEQAPYAYQIINGKEIAVPCYYKLSGNRLTFELPEKYNTGYTLVIDPTLMYSTFSGGSGLQIFNHCTTYDTAGNLYMGGKSVLGTWPATTGAYMTAPMVWNQMITLVISKYNPNGSALLYATFFGGSGSSCDGGDDLHTMIINPEQELIAAGSALSENFPVTAGCYQNYLKPGGYNSGCGRDIFVSHFNSTGSALEGSTFIGGNHDEPYTARHFGLSGDEWEAHPVGLEAAADSAGNIWLVSGTASNNFPLTPNALQPYQGYYTGMEASVVFGLSPDCSQLLYSTYFGSMDCNPFDIKINKKEQIVFCGITYKYSPNFMPAVSYAIATTPGALHTVPLGKGDGFVSIIDPVSGGLVASTYVGTSERDCALNLHVDDQNNVYVLGHTYGGNYPVSPGVYSIPQGDIFIDKLSEDLSTSLLSTRMGNAPFVNGNGFVPTSFMVDQCGNTYISGAEANYNQPVTPDAFMPAARRFWMGVLSPGFAALRFATYFGATLPASLYPGYYTWHTFDHFHAGRHHSDPKKGLFYHSICVGNTATFPTTAGSFSPGSWAAATDMAAFKFDFHAFAQKDTIVTVDDATICFGDSIKITASDHSGFDYVWNTGISSDSVWANTTGTYFVQYRKEEPGCNLYVDSIHVDKIPLPSIVPGDTTCTEGNYATARVVVGDNNVHIYTYNWFNATTGALIKTTTSSSSDSVSGLAPGLYGIQITTAGGCDTILPVNLEGWSLPDMVVNPADTTIRYGDTIQLHVSGAYIYTWYPTSSLDSATITDPLAAPRKPTRYEVIGISEKGCRDTAYIYVNIDYSMPDMIPNAFSPNGDGLNDLFRIEGMKFQRILAFNVFNRFGERVFSTLDPHAGWDGSFKGRPCDVGTYYYQIGLSYPDGKVKTFKGDVVLIR